MDANELIEEFLVEHVDTISTRRPPVWCSYHDPLTGKQVWYDEEEMWDWLGGHDNPSIDTKSLNSSQGACLKKGVMLQFIHFFLSYLQHFSHLILSLNTQTSCHNFTK